MGTGMIYAIPIRVVYHRVLLREELGGRADRPARRSVRLSRTLGRTAVTLDPRSAARATVLGSLTCCC